MAKCLNESWHVNSIDVPVKIYMEWRSNNRISIGRQHIIMRVPRAGSMGALSEARKWGQRWVERQFERHPAILNRFVPRMYSSGEIILTPRKNYTIRLSESNYKNHKVWIENDNILVRVGGTLDCLHINKTVSGLLARCIGYDQHEEISARIHELNQNFFQKPLGKIRIRHNHSNWGSCSSKGNITIAARTLLAPLHVQDYIFIHELGHLTHMNHSKDYWNLISQCLPDYKMYENWLRREGSRLTF